MPKDQHFPNAVSSGGHMAIIVIPALIIVSQDQHSTIITL